jgi:hypothetical protein
VTLSDDTPITWGQLKRAVKEAGRIADAYGDSHDPHEEIAQQTASIALAHLEAALDKEMSR